MGRHDRVVEALAVLGGSAATADLRALTSRRAVRAAVADGAVVQPRRGSVRLPVLDATPAAVHDLRAVRSHLSAALHYGWEVAAGPVQPMVTVPRSGHVASVDRDRVRLFWGDLSPAELAEGVTSPARTVVDCARTLPFGEALAVADSALRSGQVTHDELLLAADRGPRTGRSRALRVARTADGRAANPFESLLRAIALGVPGLRVEPQVHIGAASSSEPPASWTSGSPSSSRRSRGPTTAGAPRSTATCAATPPWSAQVGGSCASCGSTYAIIPTRSPRCWPIWWRQRPARRSPPDRGRFARQFAPAYDDAERGGRPEAAELRR